MVADDLSERGAETNRKLFYGSHRFLPSGKTIETTDFSLVAKPSFLSSSLRGKTSFPPEETVSYLSSFIKPPCQHFCLGVILFNEDRNYYKCPLGLPSAHISLE
jgi:hypothetical protein